MKQVILFFIMIFLFGSCKIFFTNELRNQIEEQKIDLGKIQFYTSKKIILQRVESNVTVTEDTAKIKQTTETVIERIKLKRNLKGVCVKQFAEELEIKFEDRDSCTLKFVLVDTTAKSIYKIGALKWENNVGEVPYDGKIYYIKPRNFFFQPNSKDAALKVKRKFLHKWKISNRKAKGVEVGKK